VQEEIFPKFVNLLECAVRIIIFLSKIEKNNQKL
jgi:hypothetical protein